MQFRQKSFFRRIKWSTVPILLRDQVHKEQRHGLATQWSFGLRTLKRKKINKENNSPCEESRPNKLN